MLIIINNVEPFFKDNYKRINVREYARIMKISPPFASKTLKELMKDGILNEERDRNYIYYSANRESRKFISLSIIYWEEKLRESGLIEYLNKELINPVIILFGSFAKSEVNENSDMDVAIFSISKNKIELKKFENKLKRKIQIFQFRSLDDLKNKDLLKNILNGIKIGGNW